ncbi:zinc-binding dehydrogenase [Bacillus sp. UNC41MFS5]|uniref:zinc-binding dehydrogenase n=1 Tax=Bacillus sp. UNC41MFS5 TaxID=1449046 RepID=UPI00047969D5|nr:zinc-binding dehydrogenase [Bacillus sp. UNC41MFS5]
MIQGARIAGAAKIIACDMKPANLEITKKFGATHTVNVAEQSTEEDLKKLTGADSVFISLSTAPATQERQKVLGKEQEMAVPLW